jgi:hypothetical protein
MKLDKKLLREIRLQLDIALQGFQSNTSTVLDGLEISLGNATFDADQATFKLQIKVAGAKSQSEKALDFYADHYGLDVSKTGYSNGKSFSLVGYNSKAKKYPFEMQDLETGATYKTSAEQAQSLFAKAVQNA